MAIINEHRPDYSYYQFYTDYTVAQDVPNDRYIFTVSMYVKKLGALAVSSISGNIGISVDFKNSGSPAFDDDYAVTGSYSVNLSGMSTNESRLLLQGSIACPAKYPLETYYNRAWVISRQTSGSPGSWLERTKVDVPVIDASAPTISSTSITNISQSSVRLNYAYTAPYSCSLDILYRRLGDAQDTTVNVFSAGPSSSTNYYNLTGLASNTTYYFKIKVSCINNKSTQQDFSGSPQKTLPKYITGITVPETYVNEGETVTLTADIVPADADIKTLAFTPANSSSFQIINAAGNAVTVKGLVKGDITLTATATDGSGVSASNTLHVMRYATNLLPNRTTLRLISGQTFQVGCSIFPVGSTDTSLFYESNDTDILAVDTQGVISAVSPGSAVVTITLERAHLPTDLTATIDVLVLSEPEWISPQVPDYLSYLFIDDFYGNLTILRDMLIDEAGLTVPALPIPDTSAGCATKFSDMRIILNTVEADIDTIHGALSGTFDDTYYGTQFIWTGATTNFRSRLGRWVNWANQVYTYAFTLPEREE